MIAALKLWFDARTLREKRLLIAMAGLFVITIVWALYLPIGDALSSAKTRYTDAVIRFGETQTRVRSVEALRRSGGAQLAGPLDTVIRDRASEAGFDLASVGPAPGGGVQVAIAKAKPAALLGWIAALEGGGILVDSLSATDNGDKTVAVQMTVKAQGQ
ncbi:type II secretion system protein GspM [Sphingomonas sp. H39-1-10]|uniref:type II secretion system protein GspM n=1 Tax=Sphingomonas pollutisoli TaxID=3030829 RepID=UPI0023B91DE2|nr:type II secretion system protein GspM [Sphingomonas pollutisoli]MDF0489537.1 type II secretion system protein GspM [Sphingomonas pollutisoli]